MDNNISKIINKELKKLMKKKFFFKQPSEKKILAYSGGFLLLILLGSLLNLGILTAFLSVFPLAYVFGAKGWRYCLPLVIIAGGIVVLFASPTIIFWFGIHMIVAYMVYKTIILRRSKMLLTAATSVVIFTGLALYIFLSIKMGIITIDRTQILDFINSYVNSMVEMNQGVDKNMVLESFSSLQKSFPVTLFIMVFVYSLVLVHYTLSMLGREFVIIPVFPMFSRVMLSQKSGYAYIVVTLITFLIEMEAGGNTYSFWNILFQNITGVLSLAFILNGLFTAFFFIEEKMKSNIVKPVVFVLMLIFSPIFELLGFIDCVFKIREGYIIIKKGR